MIEQLEQRRHLSTTLTGHVLTIVGTTRSDDIAIAAGRETFFVHDNGTQTAFATRQVRTIRIFGLAGDDSIIVSPRLGIRCSIEAGSGHDRVGGGAGNDTIMGSYGNDTLVGNGGADYLDGGRDDDRIEDVLGVNMIHGGGGSDTSVTTGPFGTFLSGVETPLTPTGPFASAADNSIYVDNGRLMLKYTFSVGGGGDDYGYTGPSPRADGPDEIVFAYSVIGGGAITFPDSITVDITESQQRGLVFARETNDPTFIGDFVLPILLPTR